MTFDAFETTDGSPVELLTFANGPDIFRRTNAVKPITVLSNVFTPLAYTRSKFSQSKDSDDNNITMRVPNVFELVALYSGVFTSFTTTCTIERFHLDDPGNEIIVIWKGTLASINHQADEASLLLQPLTSGQEVTPPDTFSGLCNAFLFQSPGCLLSRDDFRFIATLSTVDSTGILLTFNGLRLEAATIDAAQGGPTGPLTSDELDIYWQGGYIQTGAGEVRDIVEGNIASDPDTVRIILPFRDFQVGEGANVFAGCDLSVGTCHKKFDNAINFQGYPYIPEIDPANTELPPGTRTSSSRFAGTQ
jgi:hypothetical protein